MVIKPTSGVSNQVIEQLSAELYKKAHERVVNEIVDKHERIAKNLCEKDCDNSIPGARRGVSARRGFSSQKMPRRIIVRVPKMASQKT